MEANTERTGDTRKARVLALLGAKLPKDTSGLQNVLREAEACYIGIITARVQAGAELATKREQYRHPKDKDLTDLDRKIMLDAYVSDLQASYDLLLGIEKALEQRISVIQTLLVQ